MELWKQYQEWKTSCKWVDLSWELSPDVPHMDMFPALQVEKIMDIATDGANVFKYDVVGQYATHVDAPCHFSAGGKTLNQFSAQDLVMPLCVIDRSDAVRKDPDYALGKEDLLAWESEHGSIPKGAFVAFRSD